MTEYLAYHARLPPPQHYHHPTLQFLGEASVLFHLRKLDPLQAYGIKNWGTKCIGGIITCSSLVDF
jgi:hypothetical protein